MTPPVSMQAVDRWLVWRFSSDGKKLPHDPKNPQGRAIDSTDETLWVDYDSAAKVVAAGGVDGLGFVLGDGWAGVDLDDVRDPSTNLLTSEAQAIVNHLDSYTEASPSGTGVKIFVKASLGKNHKRVGLEIYGYSRYFTVTGQHLEGTPAEPQPRTDQIAALIAKEFPAAAEPARTARAVIAVADGGRNNGLASFGGALRRQGLSQDEILAAMLERNKQYQPPLDEREVQTIAKSISRYTPVADRYPLSEQGDAEFLAACFGDQLRRDLWRDRWLTINDVGLWLPNRMEVVAEYAVSTMRERQRLANEITDADQKRRAWTWAFRGESRSRLANMLRLAQDIPPLADRGLWDQHRHLLGAPNGVIDLRSGELRQAQPDERVTMCVGIDYAPDARSLLWERALADIFPHPGLTEFVQVIVGYSITGETDADKWFMLNGGGRNGKGTVQGPIQSALGDYALELPAKIFDKRHSDEYDLAKLPGKRFITCSESGDTIHLNHDRIKQLSGGGSLRAADKYEKSFEFIPEAKLWLTCNKRPKVTDDTIAFWTRVLVIPFTVTFAGHEDRSLRPTLERDPVHQRAVLAWLVRGAVRYYQGGIGVVPAVVQEATAAYREESDPLTEFYATCCVQEPGAQVKASALFDAYRLWTSQHGIRFAFGQRAFGQMVGGRFARKVNNGQWYTGIGLRDSVHEQQFPEASGF
jgi:putative DNA primase/helicase